MEDGNLTTARCSGEIVREGGDAAPSRGVGGDKGGAKRHGTSNTSRTGSGKRTARSKRGVDHAKDRRKRLRRSFHRSTDVRSRRAFATPGPTTELSTGSRRCRRTGAH